MLQRTVRLGHNPPFPCSIGVIQEALTLKSQLQNLAREPFYSGFVYQLLRSALTREKEARPLHPEPISIVDVRCSRIVNRGSSILLNS